MCAETEREFIDLMNEMSAGIVQRMKQYFPQVALEKICHEAPEARLKEVFPNLRRDWFAHVYRSGSADNYEELVTIFIINLVGGFNRVKLPDNVDRGKLVYIYLASVERLLGYAKYRERFVSLSNRLMLRRAA